MTFSSHFIDITLIMEGVRAKVSSSMGYRAKITYSSEFQYIVSLKKKKDFIYSWETHRESEAERQAEGEAGSM